MLITQQSDSDSLPEVVPVTELVLVLVGVHPAVPGVVLGEPSLHLQTLTNERPVLDHIDQ